MTDSALARDTAFTAGPDDDTAHVVLSDRWGIVGGSPNGGYLLAAALRPLAARAPLPDPLVVSASYLRPGAPGDATVRTAVLRTGRRVATGTATLEQEGRPVVQLTAGFTDRSALAEGVRHTAGPPTLPPPDECVDGREAAASALALGATIAERVEVRSPVLPGYATGEPTGDPDFGCWLRLADGTDPDGIALAALVDALPPVVMELGVRGSSTVQLTVHVHAAAATGWLVARSTTRHVVGGFHEEDVELWDAEGRLLAQSRQLAVVL